MKKRFELSVSELMQLRNDGYSNKDIARILDISLPTVYRYIGKQGCHIPSATEGFVSKPTPPEKLPEVTPQIAVISQTVAIDGYLFELPRLSQSISVSFCDGQSVKIDDIERFFNALKIAKEYMTNIL